MIRFDLLQIAFFNSILPIIAFFSIAYAVHRLSNPLVQRLRPVGSARLKDRPYREERLRTLQALMSNAVSIVAFIVATLASLSLFFQADTLLWVVGLFSAAFGLGARPFISDFLTGLSFIFEDIFYVGDKIEIPLFPQRVEGVVEKVTLRITQVRGMDGELFTMPNGDIRLVRNFSRGNYSPASVTITVPAEKLGKVLDHLDAMSLKAMALLPNLIEPWQVINKTGALSDEVELTVLAKAKFGKGAEMRTRLLALLQEEISSLKVSVEIDEEAGDMKERRRIEEPVNEDI